MGDSSTDTAKKALRAERESHGSGRHGALTIAEKRLLLIFRRFLVAPGEMLCFYGSDLSHKKETLKKLVERQYLSEERFKGGYSLTSEGFAAMKECT
ncbi:MAG TPA: hypothetical protein VFQ26_02270 [Nitrospiraceae bacterium]|nr:hypothetical protein [Nitrospiraceae bacterium]